MPWQLENSLNWNLIQRQNYERQIIEGNPDYTDMHWTGSYTYRAIEPIQIITPYKVLAIGIDSTLAPRHWRYAGSAFMFLPSAVSSTQEIGGGRVRLAEVPLRLFELNFIQFPELTLDQYELEIRIPYWIEQISLEAWWYSGASPLPSSEALDRIEAKLDSLLRGDDIQIDIDFEG